MKAGYGFIGENLTKAREVRGISQPELARRIGVSRQAVSQYENNTTPPGVQTLTRIAEELKLPLHYFLRVLQSNDDHVFNRVNISAATKSVRKTAERRFEWLKEIVRYLREYVTFPKVHFPQFDVPENPHRMTDGLIEELATETRRYWGLGDGVISNVIWLLENNGAIVSRYYLDHEKYDAFSVLSRSDETPYIVLGADKGIAVRSRFDACHELAHILLHRNIDRAQLNRSSDFSLIERQAHRFAAAFLFPAPSYLEEVFVPSLDAFQALKSKWRVSIQTQIHRGRDLGVISQEQAERLWINCNRKGWKYKEPLDAVIPVEQPRLLRRAMQMLIDENVQSRSDIADIAEVTGIPVEAFNEKVSASILSLKPAYKDISKEQEPTEQPDAPNNTGQILQFRKSS